MTLLRRVRNYPLVVNVLVPIGAVIGALVIGALLLLIARANPFAAYERLIVGPVGSSYGLSETLVKATPLLLISVGICIAFRGGILNIGAEGQLIAGALASTAVALWLKSWPAFALLPITMLAGFASGAACGAIPGVLKARLGVNEILSTIMMNNIALQVLYLLLRGPMIDPAEKAYGTGYPQSPLLPDAALLPRLVSGTRIHAGLILAIAAAILAYIFLWRTTIGYRIRTVGLNQAAARYAGIHVPRYLILAMVLSGGLAGLAGTIEVAGIHHRLLDGISAGYGFSGIVAALFGKLHPLGAIPASLVFGGLLIGSEMMQRAVGVPAGIVNAMQGLIVLFVVSADILSRRARRVSAPEPQSDKQKAISQPRPSIG